MTFRRGVTLCALAAGLVAAWQLWPSSNERAVRARLDTLTAVANRAPGDGLAAVTWAAELGHFFTEDVVIDLGESSAPISGRSALIAMAARLGPRAGEAKLRLDDVAVAFDRGSDVADVRLTASFVRPATATEAASLDAREFALELVRGSGGWQIARVRAVDTLQAR